MKGSVSYVDSMVDTGSYLLENNEDKSVECCVQPLIQTLNLGCKSRLLICVKSDLDPLGRGGCFILTAIISFVQGF